MNVSSPAASDAAVIRYPIAAKQAKALIGLLRLVEDLGGAVPADAPLIRYRPDDFLAAAEAGHLSLDQSGVVYGLTAKGRARLETKAGSIKRRVWRSSVRPVRAMARYCSAIAAITARFGLAMEAKRPGSVGL